MMNYNISDGNGDSTIQKATEIIGGLNHFHLVIISACKLFFCEFIQLIKVCKRANEIAFAHIIVAEQKKFAGIFVHIQLFLCTVIPLFSGRRYLIGVEQETVPCSDTGNSTGLYQ